MLRLTQIAGFGRRGDHTPPSITSASSVTVDGLTQLAFSVITNKPSRLAIGGPDAGQVEFASNGLSNVHVLRWLSNGTRSNASPQDTNSDNVYNITLTPTDQWGVAGAAQSLAITVDYDWVTTFSASMGGNISGWNGFTLRQVLPASVLSQSGSKVRLTLLGGIFGTFSIDGCYIGEQAASGDPYDMKASPALGQFRVGGSTSFASTAAAQTIVTDALDFTIDETKSYVVTVHFNGAEGHTSSGTVSGSTNYFKNATDATTLDATGYTSSGAGSVRLIKNVQVAQPPQPHPDTLVDSDVINVPSVSRLGGNISPSLIESTDTFSQPVITTGPRTLSHSAVFSSADTFFQPTVSRGSRTLAPPAVSSDDSAFLPSVITQSGGSGYNNLTNRPSSLNRPSYSSGTLTWIGPTAGGPSTSTDQVQSHALTLYNAPYITSADGEVVEYLDIRGSIYIGHNNVTIRRCRQLGGDFMNISVGGGTTGTVIEDCIIDGTGGTNANQPNSTYHGISKRPNYVIQNVTVRRCVLKGTANQIVTAKNTVIKDNWFHGNTDTDDDQCEMYGGTNNVVIEHNTFDSSDAAHQINAGVNLTDTYTEGGGVLNVQVTNNTFLNCKYGICDSDDYLGGNGTVTWTCVNNGFYQCSQIRRGASTVTSNSGNYIMATPTSTSGTPVNGTGQA